MDELDRYEGFISKGAASEPSFLIVVVRGVGGGYNTVPVHCMQVRSVGEWLGKFG